VSDQIEKKANSRSKAPVKVLILGQAESGTLSSLIYPLVLPACQHDTCPVLVSRQVDNGKRFFAPPRRRMLNTNLSPLFFLFLLLVFQMLYARQGREAEHMSWRTVIHLNLVRSVNRILDALDSALKTETASRVNLLRMRLSPLRRVQRDLETHLGLTRGDEAADSGIFRRPAEGRQLRSVLRGRR
jgi:hypothetical protein